VKSHHGHVVCESEPGRGSTFKVYFPTLGKAGQELCEEKGEDFMVMRGTETILLADDEAGIREYCKELLSGCGYTVLTERSGEGALEVFLREKGRIDLVILNVIMAGMGGKRCLDEMLKLDPQVKVLMMTGYAFNDRIREALEAGARGVLNKPFRAQDMAKMVRRILDEEPTPGDVAAGKSGPGLRVVVSN